MHLPYILRPRDLCIVVEKLIFYRKDFGTCQEFAVHYSIGVLRFHKKVNFRVRIIETDFVRTKKMHSVQRQWELDARYAENSDSDEKGVVKRECTIAASFHNGKTYPSITNANVRGCWKKKNEKHEELKANEKYLCCI